MQMKRCNNFRSVHYAQLIRGALCLWVVLTSWSIVLSTRDPFDAMGKVSQAGLLENIQKHSESTKAEAHLNVSRVPTFFLHLGPHKTATTSIQCAMYMNRDELEEKDSIKFLGKVDGRFCSTRGSGKIEQDWRIQKLDDCFHDPVCWPGWLEELDDWKTRGFNLVLSKEAMSGWASSNHSSVDFRNQFWPALGKALKKWRVVVILSYRVYHQWLPSALIQHAHHMRLQAREPWPRSHEVAMNLGDNIDMVLKGAKPPPYPYVDSILDHQFPLNWEIRLLNMHHSESIVSDFICETLKANGLCSQHKELLATSARESPASELTFDYLNVQALQWGWMSAGKRGARMRETKRFVRRIFSNEFFHWPFHCPTQSIQSQLLETSILMERAILGSVDVSKLRQDFFSSAHRLCEVNASAVLLRNETVWKNFYHSLI